MYDIADDVYCYPNSTVLRNLAGVRGQRALDRYELAMTTQRADEPFPPGRLSVTHYRAIHRHLFQDVYIWAGDFRRVRIARQGSMFCYPENIAREMKSLFTGLRDNNYLRELSRDDFTRGLTAFISDLNAIHPFREGNGRTQLSFTALIAARSGHRLDFSRLRAKSFVDAIIRSFHGKPDALKSQLLQLLEL